jgi:hypothetical protein
MLWTLHSRGCGRDHKRPACGSRHAGYYRRLRTIRPGCIGFFMGICLSPPVTVDELNIAGINTLKSENDPPVGPYPDCPITFAVIA